MGQMVIGLMLGCKIPKRIALHNEEFGDGEVPGLIDVWENENHKNNAPEVEHDAGVFGFWLFQEHEDFGDKARALDDLPKSKEYRTALKNWTAFSKWAVKQGVKLPEPQLFLAQTEVA